MREKTALRDDARRRVEEIGKVDLIVGIPSFNNKETIGYVVKTAAEGLERFFPEMRTLIVNSDGGSPDGTPDVVMETETPANIEKIATVYQGTPGKGTSFRAIFEIAEALEATACVVVDSDLRSITPEWIELLASPVIRDRYEYVTPYYARHKHDGSITNNIAYPLTRALYGKRVRQPIGGDFGLAGALAGTYLDKDMWDSDVARFGIDIFMTTTAINEGFEVCQANLGAKIHDAKDPAASLGPMFRQVVGSLFSLMRTYEPRWRQVKGSEAVRSIGQELTIEPEPVNVTISALMENFRVGFQKFGPFWKSFLRESTFQALSSLTELAEEHYRLPEQLWARVVYDFSVEYNRGRRDPSEVVESMTPLYFGRVASFVLQAKEMSSREAEAVVEEQAEVFEREKSYLIQRWDEE